MFAPSRIARFVLGPATLLSIIRQSARPLRLERLHDEYGRHLRARNFHGVHEVNDAFHLAMFAACGNKHLVESIKHYMWLSLPVRSKKTADYEHAAASERDHHMIIQLLKGTDSWALAQLCVDHLQGAKAAYMQMVADTADN